jgi:SEC-C motif-containing protein
MEQNIGDTTTRDCPCGSQKTYEDCCQPIIRGGEKAKTAEALMRARYSAYAKHEIDFIIASCKKYDGNPKEGNDIDYNATKAWSEESTWQGLKILRTEKGSEQDSEGVVEFEAVYARKGLRDVHHETAQFEKIGGAWMYVSGKIKAMTVVREGKKTGRNEPCPCGSGKKYKQCCGR